MSTHLLFDDYSNQIAKVNLYLENPLINRNKFVQTLSANIIKSTKVGCVGFRDEAALKSYLKWAIYGEMQQKDWKIFNNKNLIEIIRHIIMRCKPVIATVLNIYIFPSVNKFTVQSMGGVSGYSNQKNTIMITLYKTKLFRKRLRETLGHELAHAIAMNYHNRRTIMDDLVFEGVAEHFREHFVGGGKSVWVKAMTKRGAKMLLKNILPHLSSESDKLYQELFFGTGKHPLWAGYAVGYYLVEDYLKQQKTIDWLQILKTSPSKIFSSSTFLNT